jgi:hypothetical protein
VSVLVSSWVPILLNPMTWRIGPLSDAPVDRTLVLVSASYQGLPDIMVQGEVLRAGTEGVEGRWEHVAETKDYPSQRGGYRDATGTKRALMIWKRPRETSARD